MAAKIRIGTSGWSYPTGAGAWTDNFYPPGTKNELEYYSGFFDTVEVNSSFYRPPTPEAVASWVKKTPDDFVFSVKLWQKFTHPKMYEAATGATAAIALSDVGLFKKSLEPLVLAGKLGALLAQFPPSFKNSDQNRQVLGNITHHFGEYRLAVELRDKSWSDDSGTAEILRAHRASWVAIDEPKFSSSVALDTPLTSNMAYFRFHGRNAEEWWQGNTETRYKYLYSPEEIGQLSLMVESVAEPTENVLVYLNNHWKAYAPRNANEIKKALQLPFVDFPVPGI